MGRPTYVCATCSEHFTRRYSARRHNLTIHDNRGEIVPLLEYIVGRKNGRYRASHPFWYRRRRSKEYRIHNFGHANTAVVADSVGDGIRLGLQQQTPFQSIPTPPSPPPLSPAPIWLPSAVQPQPQPPDVSPYPTERISQHVDRKQDQGTPEETMLKIQELKRLMYKYPIFSNPDLVIKCVTHFSIIIGDNTLLDEKLEQLRSIDAIRK
jgi:hypothetical protein